MEVTKDFKKFTETLDTDNYQEMKELYDVAKREITDGSFFKVMQANGSESDIIIEDKYNHTGLRLTPNAVSYFLKWIEDHIMNGDAICYEAMKKLEEEDREEE